ncbi:hypothetical protein NECAME_16403 [Necator americanus]|uniref:Uncharacterized protein n=1 Tax=Necator americanus TaxID=51031 RepID=W2TZ76_NECAM|nr:hypothetical protein NECAME_16403 [Necator americanus]ETN86332.1 hypothetical protein NECAME_16403 [Necator americanus]
MKQCIEKEKRVRAMGCKRTASAAFSLSIRRNSAVSARAIASARRRPAKLPRRIPYASPTQFTRRCDSASAPRRSSSTS